MKIKKTLSVFLSAVLLLSVVLTAVGCEKMTNAELLGDMQKQISSFIEKNEAIKLASALSENMPSFDLDSAYKAALSAKMSADGETQEFEESVSFGKNGIITDLTNDLTGAVTHTEISADGIYTSIPDKSDFVLFTSMDEAMDGDASALFAAIGEMLEGMKTLPEKLTELQNKYIIDENITEETKDVTLLGKEFKGLKALTLNIPDEYYEEFISLYEEMLAPLSQYAGEDFSLELSAENFENASGTYYFSKNTFKGFVSESSNDSITESVSALMDDGKLAYVISLSGLSKLYAELLEDMPDAIEIGVSIDDTKVNLTVKADESEIANATLFVSAGKLSADCSIGENKEIQYTATAGDGSFESRLKLSATEADGEDLFGMGSVSLKTSGTYGDGKLDAEATVSIATLSIPMNISVTSTDGVFDKAVISVTPSKALLSMLFYGADDAELSASITVERLDGELSFTEYDEKDLIDASLVDELYNFYYEEETTVPTKDFEKLLSAYAELYQKDPDTAVSLFEIYPDAYNAVLELLAEKGEALDLPELEDYDFGWDDDWDDDSDWDDDYDWDDDIDWDDIDWDEE